MRSEAGLPISLNKIFAIAALTGTGLILSLIVLYPPLVLARQALLPGGDFSHILSRGTLKALNNSLITATGVFLFSSFIGTLLAWLRVRTDIWGKKMMDACVLLAFIIPPYVLGISWMQIFGSGGYLNRLTNVLVPGSNYSFPYYSMGATMLVLGLHLYPLSYFAIKNTLLQLDPELETASIQCGASRRRTFFAVTLPGIFPALLSTGLLVFSRALANFSVPALLCLPVRKELLTTRIYASLGSLNTRDAALLSFGLVLISTLLFSLQIYISACFSRGVVKRPGWKQSGSIQPLGRFRTPATLTAGLFLFLSVILPLWAMLLSSFMKRWGLPLKPQYLTFHNYLHLLTGEKTRRAFLNSLGFGAAAGGIALIAGSATAFISHTRRSAAGRILEAVASWPMAFPNIVLAVGAIMAWNRAPFYLYGTARCIIAAYAALFTPLVMKQISALLENQDPLLLQAARTSGAGPAHCFTTVTLPSILPGIESGILVCMLITLREIPIALMLYSSGQETTGVLLFGMQSQSYGLEMTSALAVTIIILNLFRQHVYHQHQKERQSCPVFKYAVSVSHTDSPLPSEVLILISVKES